MSKVTCGNHPIITTAFMAGTGYLLTRCIQDWPTALVTSGIGLGIFYLLTNSKNSSSRLEKAEAEGRRIQEEAMRVYVRQKIPLRDNPLARLNLDYTDVTLDPILANKKKMLIERALFHMNHLCTDYQNRLAQAKNSFKVLNKGLFYSSDYFDLLQFWAEKGNQEAKKRLEEFKEKDLFTIGICPPQFEVLRDGSGKSLTGFYNQQYGIKSEEKPSRALKAFIEGLTFVDCHKVCQLAYFLALLDVQGEKWFDAYYANEEGTQNPLFIGNMFNIRQQLFKTLFTTTTQEEMGSIVQYTGPERYSLKHLTGVAGNYFTMSHGEARFGFGLTMKQSHEKGVIEVLYEEFNKRPRDPQKFLSSESYEASNAKSSFDLWKNVQYSREQFVEQGGGRKFIIKISNFALKNLLSWVPSGDKESKALTEVSSGHQHNFESAGSVVRRSSSTFPSAVVLKT